MTTKAAQQPAQTDEEFVKRYWVYAGRRIGSTVPFVDCYYPLKETDVSAVKDAKLPKAEERISFAPHKSIRIIGGVYEMETNKEISRARTSTAQFVGLHSDSAQRLEWKAEHDMIMTQAAAVAAEKRFKREGGNALEALAPLRRVYQSSVSSTQRAAIEVCVLQYLRSSRVTSASETFL